MSDILPSPSPGSFPTQKKLLFAAILVALGLLPPETRGESQIGVAALVAVAALLTWAEPFARRGRAILALLLVLAVPAVRASLAPGSAVEPVATALLGCVGGLTAAASFPALGRGDGVLLVPGLSAGLVGVHAIYQRIAGLSALAAVVEADPSIPDRDLILARIAEGRSFGAFATPAALGGFLAMMLPVTVALAWTHRGRLRPALWLAATLQAAGLVLSASATAAGALVAATVVAAILALGRVRAAVVVAVLLLGAVVVLRGSDVLSWSRPEGPWRLRAGNFRAAVEMARDHPIRGVGPGGYGEMFPAYARSGDSRTKHAHDLPLELVAELGLPLGMLASVAFFWIFLGPLLRHRVGRDPPLRAGIGIALAAFAIQNLGDFTAFLPSLLWVACILRGIVTEGTGQRSPVPSSRLVPAVALMGALMSAAVCALGGAAWNLRYEARLAAAAGDDDAAERTARSAARLAPWNVDGRILLSEVALSRDSIEMAEREIEAAIRMSPVRPVAREVRARCRLRRGDLPGALADWTEAARLYPEKDAYADRRDALAARIVAMLPGRAP